MSTLIVIVYVLGFFLAAIHGTRAFAGEFDQKPELEDAVMGCLMALFWPLAILPYGVRYFARRPSLTELREARIRAREQARDEELQRQKERTSLRDKRIQELEEELARDLKILDLKV